MIMTSVVDKGLDEDYIEIERRLKIAQVGLFYHYVLRQQEAQKNVHVVY